MTNFYGQMDEGECGDEHLEHYGSDESVSVRLGNADAENGYEQQPGPLTWLNSARVTLDPKDDAVHCVVSVGDPRGGFGFTVRRLPNGQMVIHMPHPGEGMAHMKTAEHHTGTLIVVDDRDGRTPVDFSDPEPSWVEDVSRLSRERCVELLEGIGIQCFDDEDVAELREAVGENVADGSLDPENVE